MANIYKSLGGYYSQTKEIPYVSASLSSERADVEEVVPRVLEKLDVLIEVTAKVSNARAVSSDKSAYQISLQSSLASLREAKASIADLYNVASTVEQTSPPTVSNQSNLVAKSFSWMHKSHNSVSEISGSFDTPETVVHGNR